jgi:hypothetical protein
MTTLALCLVTRLPETEPLRLLRGRERLGHFQHGMMVLFVRELTRNLPSLTKIELYRDQIRLNDAKAAGLATASSYLGFTLCEQSSSDTLSPVLPKHPQVIDPPLVRYYHPRIFASDTATHASGQSSSLNFRGTGFGAKRSLNVSVATISMRSRTESYSWGCGLRITTSIGMHLS